MSWTIPSSRIEGFRIQVMSDAGQYGASTYVSDLNLPVYTHTVNAHTAVDLLLDFLS